MSLAAPRAACTRASTVTVSVLFQDPLRLEIRRRLLEGRGVTAIRSGLPGSWVGFKKSDMLRRQSL